MGWRDEGKIFGAVAHGLILCPLIGPVNDGKTILEMQGLYRMNIDADLSAVQACPAGRELEGLVTGDDHVVRSVRVQQTLIVNIICDKIIEEIQTGNDITGRVNETDIFL